ncbi:MAG: hypothetical protein KGJ55_04855 [Gammaproteobacteria bacterium]|nr:hypothetical protein [Gammaproteobacteria bacterium]
MTVSTEALLAYVDGELPAEEARRVEAEIATRPDLWAYVEQQRALRNGVRDAFEAILRAPVPDALLAVATRRPSLRWRIGQAWRGFATRRVLLRAGLPVAAALACGVTIGVLMTGLRGANVVSGGGNLIARGPLAAALTDQLAARQSQDAQTRIGISFRDRSGHYCRSFETAGAAPMAGVACHEGGNWRIAVLAGVTPQSGANAPYRPAGSAMPDSVRGVVRDMIAGPPLDAAGERTARAHGWRIK